MTHRRGGGAVLPVRLRPSARVPGGGGQLPGARGRPGPTWRGLRSECAVEPRVRALEAVRLPRVFGLPVPFRRGGVHGQGHPDLVAGGCIGLTGPRAARGAVQPRSRCRVPFCLRRQVHWTAGPPLCGRPDSGVQRRRRQGLARSVVQRRVPSFRGTAPLRRYPQPGAGLAAGVGGARAGHLRHPWRPALARLDSSRWMASPSSTVLACAALARAPDFWTGPLIEALAADSLRPSHHPGVPCAVSCARYGQHSLQWVRVEGLVSDCSR